MFVFVIGLVLGFVAAGLVIRAMVPSRMINTVHSPYAVEETVSRLEEAAVAQGWRVMGVKPLDESIRKNGGASLPPIQLVEVCQAGHASQLLEADERKFISVMLPCTIAVYARKDGSVQVSTLNASLMGRLFGGVVAKIMGKDVATDQAEIINKALAKTV